VIVPVRLMQRIAAALAAAGRGSVQLVDQGSVGGGCISNATKLGTDGGAQYFLKWGNFAAGIFACEAAALRTLEQVHAVRVPAVIAFEDQPAADQSWLLLEWLEPGRMTAQTWQQLGASLAELHRTRGKRFGWSDANFIGSLPQRNEWRRDWPEFWREARILPQVERAARAGALQARERRRIDSLAQKIEGIAAAGNEDGASLLHGDLWSGNVHALASGGAALIDPSIYYGHREVDLAMADLFGGFASDFFAAYEEAWPLLPGSEERRLLYQLYYLLVHVNLFGGSYVAQTMNVVSRLGC